MHDIHDLTNVKIDNFKRKQWLVVGVSESLKSAQTKISETETRLTEVSDRVDQHENKFQMTTKKQEELEALINDRIQYPGSVAPSLMIGST